MLFIQGLPWRASLAIAAGLALMSLAQATALADSQSLIGGWDLNLGVTGRECRLIRRNEVVAFSATPTRCQRPMPVLADIAGWGTDASPLNGLSEKILLQFPANQDGTLLASRPEGEPYMLTPTDPARIQFAAVASRPPNQSSAGLGFQVAQGSPSTAVLSPVKSAELPGRYSIWREGRKDTGCMLTLDNKARGPKGGLKAVLSPACRDQGMVIFDPAGWNVERSRLVLTARKGHQAHFDRQSDGSWAKDPKDGKGLILKRM